jgi:DNA-binding NtrC family response regulator
VPPLRARGTDVLLLAQHFLARFAAAAGKPVTGIVPAAARLLLRYSWPGNVRELRNCMEHAVALTRTDRVIVGDLPAQIRSQGDTALLAVTSDPDSLLPLVSMERRYIRHVLAATGGNRSAAARILGLDRKTLYRKLRPAPGAGTLA